MSSPQWSPSTAMPSCPSSSRPPSPQPFALLSSFLSFLLVATLTTAICAQTTADVTLHITDQTDFCLFLPPKPNVNISKTDALVYCVNPPPRPIPSNFIYSAHHVNAVDASGEVVFQQVTGQYDVSKFPFTTPASTDPELVNITLNTQYDSGSGLFPLPSCTGYAQFIQIIGNSTYCVRCCKAGAQYCTQSFWPPNCVNFLGGNFGPGFDNKNVTPALTLPVVAYPIDVARATNTSTASTSRFGGAGTMTSVSGTVPTSVGVGATTSTSRTVSTSAKSDAVRVFGVVALLYSAVAASVGVWASL
ncbi:hypothetical protein M427DRAFT_130628 [Gonapodya prolifera JEL478]|uniref:Uncharacterized protein n=1 Tax=Gonapodya prolifera (strain JEL478) TaxID=1344416 RepID=A0A139AZ22_GONPJ|nr:hypothetical protein M427DRAFT_130628 [Gonapodya prolifera JEL478]|eukprot:KXS21954.1 hypothetical protein M427DRAFT_130628 [Gonapodya prolifera JEL478]